MRRRKRTRRSLLAEVRLVLTELQVLVSLVVVVLFLEVEGLLLLLFLLMRHLR